ncbi:MAG TPA: TonB-dependent receptor [Terriglobales bacterium]|nr:TonB-dependent receptor [Terriglobales bacterium]
MPVRILSFSLVLVLSAAAGAADLQIIVTDPQSAVLTGARVFIYPANRSEASAIGTTAADGSASFSGLAAGLYRISVLAPGFAPQNLTTRVEEKSVLRVKLALATVPQTVVVSATRTPVSEQDAGAPVGLLDQQDLVNLQPTSEADALRVLPGAIVGTTGRRGSQGSLFVRGGDSDYNKVLVDGVPVNEPGGFFDFGVVPLQETSRVEFLRGAESTLYGSDAMTSVVQFWTGTGNTREPEFRFGADGGNFATAHGFAALAGARGPVDYDLFADQFNTQGQGINDVYTNSSQGENVGVRISPNAIFRLRSRHSNNWSGVQSNWNFNGDPLLAPDIDQYAHQNNFLSSAELTLAAPQRWQHRFSGFEYHHRRFSADRIADRGCSSTFLDCPFAEFAHQNRAGFEYQGEYAARGWATTTFGYRFEDENAHNGELITGSDTTGVRRNHAVYGQQILVFSRFSLIPGVRFEHNESFGNKAVPRVAATFLAIRGAEVFSGTRLRFVYGTGIKEPSFEESFGIAAFLITPNPNLKPEESRSFEAGLEQNFLRGKVSLSASYFNNLFTHQIECCQAVNPQAGTTQFFNLNRSFAQGAELELHARPRLHLRVDGSYSYTSTQILSAPLGSGALFSAGAPLIRRPKHSGTLLVSYFAKRWGASLAGTFVGPRADSDFTFGVIPAVNHVAGYARLDPGVWYAITPRITAYVNVQNALDKSYQEVVGYPALGANFRAGMRFRLGGD